MEQPSPTNVQGPHRAIGACDPQEQFTLQLLDRLWDCYRNRVPYVSDYERMIDKAGAKFVNDHIAFRTFASQHPATGIASISRIFEALDYRGVGCYHFPDKHLGAIHFQHAHPRFPKLFISELKTWELDGTVRQAIERTIGAHREPVDSDTLASLASLKHGDVEAADTLMERVVSCFHQLPWDPPTKSDLMVVNELSQYAAWVLVHGYNVNHFTALINSHGVPALDDIEKTVDALSRVGVPMKQQIEGDPGSKLRQSATAAAVLDVAVRENGSFGRMPWTYAYFELAERNEVTDAVTGQPVRFEGFLGAQATNLFEMTRK